MGLFSLSFQPGVQRDGTEFDAQRCLDALWCRWRLGRPRKMGGFRQITNALLGPGRRLHCFYQGAAVIIHVGSSNGIQQVVIDQYGELVSISNRTPVGFTSGANIGFTFDSIFDTTSGVVQLVAHAVPDISFAASDIQTVPYIGQIDSPGPLTQFGTPSDTFGGSWIQPDLAGGVVCVQPFVFGYDSAGRVLWSAPNLPLTLGVTGGTSGAGTARISAQKVIAGMPVRGGGVQSPAVLFWTLSEVISGTFAGQASGEFAFNTISPSSSILSTDCVIEYDGLYFWPGIDRFLVYNGTVEELPNPQNQDWFFDNLTPGMQAKTFAFKVPRYGEIWWCAPMFGSTEPNYAIIFNLRENAWYDTMLPNSGRGAGYFAQGFRYPIMTGVDATSGGYQLWMHEFGVDQLVGSSNTAVRSYFETPWFGGPKNDPPNDPSLSLQQLEPDILQAGDLTVSLINAANARAPQSDPDPRTILQVPSIPQEQFVSWKKTKRLNRLHFESNVVGGNFIIGRNLVHGDPSDNRLES